MSCVCLNINGCLSSKLECDDFIKLVNCHDVIFLSETWTNKYSNLNLDGFIPVAKHRRKKVKARRESGGLVCYFRESIFRGIHEEKWSFEDGLCFRLDKTWFGWDKDIFLLCVYMRSNESTREDMNDDIDCYEILLDQIASVSERGNVLIAGDMNGRTAMLDESYLPNQFDTINFENVIDLENVISVDDFINNSMSVKRHNCDHSVNAYGRKLIELCQSADLAILNGRTGLDRGIGKFTFCNHKGPSTIDYVLSNKNLLYDILDFIVHDFNVFSDHCLIQFCLSTRMCNFNQQENVNIVKTIQWRKNWKDEYVSN